MRLIAKKNIFFRQNKQKQLLINPTNAAEESAIVLFQAECHRGAIAYMFGAEELYRAGVNVLGAQRPFATHLAQCSVRFTIISTNAFRITGFIFPLRRSIFIIIVMGTPPASHSDTGSAVFLIAAM